MKKKTSGINKWLISFVVFALVAGACWAIFSGICQHINKDNLDKAQTAAQKYSLSLELLARDMVTDTGRMADVARQQRANDGWFMSAAQSIAKQNTNILGIQYSPLGRPPVAYPAGFSFGGDSGLAPAFTKMQDAAIIGDGSPQVLSPVKLQSGTQGVIAMTPVFLYNNRTQNFDYLGNVALVMKLPEAIQDKALQEIQDAGYNYAIYGNNGTLEQDGLVARSEGDLDENAAEASAKVPGGHWQVKLSVMDSWAKSAQTMGILISLVIGAILGGLTLWGLSARQQRAVSRRALMTDSLTQIGNKRALQEYLAGMCHQLKAHFVVACMDIDNLKDFNKNYGRDTGDAVLKEVARRVASCLKDDDRLFRLGEDTFVAVVDNESLEGVSRRLEEIRQKVSMSFEYGDLKLRTYIDVGCSAFPMDARKPNELVKIADQRMNVKKGNVFPEGTDWLGEDDDQETSAGKEASGEKGTDE